MCDLTTHAHLDAFIIESPSVQSLELLNYVLVMNMNTSNTSRRALKPSEDKNTDYGTGENKRRLNMQ